MCSWTERQEQGWYGQCPFYIILTLTSSKEESGEFHMNCYGVNDSLKLWSLHLFVLISMWKWGKFKWLFVIILLILMWILQMVILLIEHLCGHEPGITDDLSAILEQLTKLNSSKHSRVALRARQVSEKTCLSEVDRNFILL